MATVGRLTTAQLEEYLNQNESDPRRRERLFIPFGGPRAELLNRLRTEIINFLIDEKENIKHNLILDYGCGVQPYRLAFDRVNANMITVDIGENAEAQIRISDDNRLPFKADLFDYIVSFQVLEHVAKPMDYLMESYRLLKPGGKLFLTTHGVWPYHPTPGDYHRWTKPGLVYDFKQAGFDIIRTREILNENSAFLQSLVINMHYKKKLLGYKKYFHHISQIIIKWSEKTWKRESNTPGIISILGQKSSHDNN
jgi:SAM-dependent methyltransferase